MIPIGVCQCGCGGRTKICPYADNRDGYAKGDFRRFISGHNPNSAMSTIERFWSKVRKTDTCWLWGGTLTGTGYGLFYIRGQGKVRAHRAAWILAGRELPEGLLVLHRCDVKLCIRIEHLFVGTHADNSRDAASKGLYVSGEACPSAKLTTSNVRNIRQAFRDGRRVKSLAREYGIWESTIYQVVRRKTWKRIF